MKNQIIKQIKEKHNKTGGHCGTLIYNFNIRLSDLKPILNDLYKNNKITVHDGAHGKLIKLKL